MFSTVLIANRGEIALRAMRTLRRMNIRSVAVYGESDRDSQHVLAADRAIDLEGARPSDTYLRIDKLIEACRRSGAEAVFPGYGFLSENAEFAAACEVADIAFIGPTPAQIHDFGHKHRSRQLAAAVGIPLTPGTDLLSGIDDALAHARQVGYPVMLKSTAGGGGIGLACCANAAELVATFDKIRRLGSQIFGDGGIFMEASMEGARHIEVQIFGDGSGRVAALGERDCSIQRRHQKIIEETPAPHLSEAVRRELLDAAVRLGQSVHYRSAGTVEFICDPAGSPFYFLEVNARLQVEHPVTEMVTGLDLIECMLRLAAGEPLDWDRLQRKPQGASIEARIYAEDPARDFRASSGILTEVHFPEDPRIDSWIENGTEVSPHFDPLLAKVIVHGESREHARTQLVETLNATRLHGIETNLDYLRQIVASPAFTAAATTTHFIRKFAFSPRTIEVLEPGTYTTVQDYPGRTGYWNIGVPPSGPMDDMAFRLANRIVGNATQAAGLECTLTGPTLRFHSAATIALTGAECAPTLNGSPVSMWTPVHVDAGQVLTIGPALAGCRTYLAIRNGLDVPICLGSRSTFVLGQFGGHAGRILRSGDILLISDPHFPACTTPAPENEPCAPPQRMIPSYARHWEIAVLRGPHVAPDYFTRDSIAHLLAVTWQVHHNSNRLGVRLSGPKPAWARASGGEAGLHPSNVHDCVYAIGSINFTGDSPVILACDGPSLGGFVCPLTVARAELWKLGQLRPGDEIRFLPIAWETALAMQQAQDESISHLTPYPSPRPFPLAPAAQPAVLAQRQADGHHPHAQWRQAGDNCILLEYGEDILDLGLRLRVHLLMRAIRKEDLPIEELSPGVRSLQIRYDSRRIRQSDLIRDLLRIDQSLPDVEDLKIPSRVVHLPIAFEDSATRAAIQRYTDTVRSRAPWLPSNLEFLRRINGLRSVEEVCNIIATAHYIVLGLGDVYLGAPCAIPIDPRHRLLSSKYNPARTFTAEGTVGIGGMYLCIYGMDSPGGYQIVGRTLPIWNRYLRNPQFEPGKPWLLRFFDQIVFHPVEEPELIRQRDAFRRGRHQIRIDEDIFDFAACRGSLADNAASIAAFRERQRSAFAAEVARWDKYESSPPAACNSAFIMEEDRLPGGHRVHAPMHGSVWKLLAKPGQTVEANQTIVLVEAMKMELAVTAPVGGIVRALCCGEGQTVATGDILAVIEAPSR